MLLEGLSCGVIHALAIPPHPTPPLRPSSSPPPSSHFASLLMASLGPSFFSLVSVRLCQSLLNLQLLYRDFYSLCFLLYSLSISPHSLPHSLMSHLIAFALILGTRARRNKLPEDALCLGLRRRIREPLLSLFFLFLYLFLHRLFPVHSFISSSNAVAPRHMA